MRAPDPAFADPRLAALYDALHGDRTDLDAYVAIAVELAARSVVDVGCGTGALALRLGSLDLHVVGVDPAGASLELASAKPHGDRVRWVEGDASALDSLQLSVDLAVMTGNVAQVFVTDEDWTRTLRSVHGSLRPGGWFVFETRRPEVRDWEQWELPDTPCSVPGVTVSRTVTDVALPLVTFETTTTIDGETLPSSSTLRFRDRAEVERDLSAHGFEVVDLRDAPDRPGKELVFLARRDGQPDDA